MSCVDAGCLCGRRPAAGITGRLCVPTSPVRSWHESCFSQVLGTDTQVPALRQGAEHFGGSGLFTSQGVCDFLRKHFGGPHLGHRV